MQLNQADVKSEDTYRHHVYNTEALAGPTFRRTEEKMLPLVFSVILSACVCVKKNYLKIVWIDSINWTVFGYQLGQQYTILETNNNKTPLLTII